LKNWPPMGAPVLQQPSSFLRDRHWAGRISTPPCHASDIPGDSGMIDDPERDPVQEELPRPTLGDLMERTPTRLLVESAVGAGGGAILSGAFPLGTEMGTLGFALSGAVAAPVALLLTPTAGSLAYRAIRYGLGLAPSGRARRVLRRGHPADPGGGPPDPGHDSLLHRGVGTWSHEPGPGRTRLQAGSGKSFPLTGKISRRGQSGGWKLHFTVSIFGGDSCGGLRPLEQTLGRKVGHVA